MFIIVMCVSMSENGNDKILYLYIFLVWFFFVVLLYVLEFFKWDRSKWKINLLDFSYIVEILFFLLWKFVFVGNMVVVV